MFDSVWRREPTVPAIPAVPETPSIAAVLLASGHLLKVRGVALYPSAKLREIAQLRQMASQKLGGVSSGIGFIGSPAWAIGSVLALGLLERAVSNSAKKEGIAMLGQADALALTLLQAAILFPVGRLSNRDEPVPSLWSAKSNDGEQYAHDGGEFVTVDTSAGLMKIRWQHVASYSIAPDQGQDGLG